MRCRRYHINYHSWEVLDGLGIVGFRVALFANKAEGGRGCLELHGWTKSLKGFGAQTGDFCGA